MILSSMLAGSAGFPGTGAAEVARVFGDCAGEAAEKPAHGRRP